LLNNVLLAVLVPSFVCFAAFSWAVKGHFQSVGHIPEGMRLTSLLSLAGFAWFVWRLFSVPANVLWPAAVALFIAALLVFGWTLRATHIDRPTLAFADDTPQFLLRHGPYRLVRHPFYASYLLFWVGTALATPGWLPWLVPIVMLTLYARAATGEEQKFARSDLAQAYETYRQSVGMFVPRLRRLTFTENRAPGTSE
jgi:protein-S-isoprenylcysteine O-methyltransferase Ste14